MVRCSFCIIISWGLPEVSLSWQVHHRGQCLRRLHYWHHHLDLLVKVAPLRLLCCDVTHLPPTPIDSQCSGKGPLKLFIFFMSAWTPWVYPADWRILLLLFILMFSLAIRSLFSLSALSLVLSEHLIKN